MEGLAFCTLPSRREINRQGVSVPLKKDLCAIDHETPNVLYPPFRVEKPHTGSISLFQKDMESKARVQTNNNSKTASTNLVFLGVLEAVDQAPNHVDLVDLLLVPVHQTCTKAREDTAGECERFAPKPLRDRLGCSRATSQPRRQRKLFASQQTRGAITHFGSSQARVYRGRCQQHYPREEHPE